MKTSSNVGDGVGSLIRKCEQICNIYRVDDLFDAYQRSEFFGNKGFETEEDGDGQWKENV